MVRIKSVLSILAVCVALIGYLPLQPYLDPFAGWFFPVALLLGLFLQGRGRSLPGRVLTPLAILLFIYIASGFTQENMLQVTADLLVVFLGVRMLGEKSGRNYLQVFALALFCLAASSLYNLSALFLVYLLLLLLLLAVSLVVLTFHSHDPEIALTRRELKKVLSVACLMPVAALPILLVLFVLLPRTQYPLWDFLNRGGAKNSGFSETVRPGGSSNVATARNVVLRALSPKVPEAKLYWRGIVLNSFNENAWVRGPNPQETPAGTEKGTSVQQEIYPEPSNTPYLLALNIPRQISGVRQFEFTDVIFRARYPQEKRIKYQVQSTLSDVIRISGGIDRDFYLKLPQSVSPRVRAKGRELSRPGLSAGEKIQLLERFFRAQRIAYATTGLPVGQDSLDAFLFAKKRGNCEFFASSAATLLRLAGVPARLVGGFRGGTYNEMGGYYLVTDDMAHVWVEAFIEGRGWLTVDPTLWSVGFTPSGGGVARKLQLYFDAVGFYWNKAVITYDLEKQIALVRKAGGKARDLRFPSLAGRHLTALSLWLLPLAVLVALFLWRPQSREARLLKRFLRAARARYPDDFRQNSGLYELAERTKDPQMQSFVAIYGAALYGDRRLQAEELVKLKEIVRMLTKHRS
jgi:protein-glutamine gamma-glutamyltransferase